MTITKVELVRDGEYKLTLELDNKIAMPVWASGSFEVINVRQDGNEFRSGTTFLHDTYDVPPGRMTFTADRPNLVSQYQGSVSPVTAFKLRGTMRVENGLSDQTNNGRFCDFKDVTFGEPLQGNWDLTY